MLSNFWKSFVLLFIHVVFLLGAIAMCLLKLPMALILVYGFVASAVGVKIWIAFHLPQKNRLRTPRSTVGFLLLTMAELAAFLIVANIFRMPPPDPTEILYWSAGAGIVGGAFGVCGLYLISTRPQAQ